MDIINSNKEDLLIISVLNSNFTQTIIISNNAIQTIEKEFSTLSVNSWLNPLTL